MTRSSRLPIDPSTHLPSLQSFSELSQFLRGAIADEESRQLSESVAQLAAQIELIVAALLGSRQRTQVAPLLVDLLTVLRGHRLLVVGLSPAWRGLYEYPGYLQALNNFRVLIGQWLLEGGPRSTELAVTADDFELVAWRTLGEGLLLIDMYDQQAADRRQEPLSQPDDVAEPQVRRALQWWKRLRL
ncbi:MAG TPA: hypothetical protein VEA35_14265 [Ramlibacter sp.]|nr:hypothetical protein [Ramlibacter sp.]